MQTVFAGALSSDDFVTEWFTNYQGLSNGTSITVPMVGGPYDVDWDNDGTFDQMGLTGPVTHDFGVIGTYTIRIRGSYTSFAFNNSVNTDKLKLLDIKQWGIGSWQTMSGAFYGARNLVVSATDNPDFSAVTSMHHMFGTEELSNALLNPNTTNWNTGNVTDMSYMFYNTRSATPDTSNWVTSKVTNMSNMFSGSIAANPNTTNWDTSKVTNMNEMFRGAKVAIPNTSLWNTGEVTTMIRMFQNADKATPDTTNWNTAKVTDMSFMFFNAVKANPNVSGWNTGMVSNMSYMFQSAQSFDRDLGSWNVSALTNAAEMLAFIALSQGNYESLLTGWNAQSLQSGVVFNGGNSIYCSTAATDSKANMETTNGWTITDGGRTCPSFDVGGQVSGLVGSGLVLQNNMGDDLIIAADGPFSFSVEDTSDYNIKVSAQPVSPPQTCDVQNGEGTVDGVLVDNVVVTCVIDDFIYQNGFEEPPRLVFVTSAAYSGGDLGSLANADAICNSLASGAGLPGTFAAWLSTRTPAVNAKDRIGNNEWARVDGAAVANNLADLTDGTLLNPINIDETGASTVFSDAWTGTGGNGNFAGPAAENCWSPGAQGSVRGLTGNTSGWSDGFGWLPVCSSPAPIYCFGL
jgi:surface protein